MNDLVKQSIDARYNAFFSSYVINDNKLIEKIDVLFEKIRELGSECSDSMEFENKFLSSSLNSDYITLFTEIATCCEPIKYETSNNEVKSDREYLEEEIVSDTKYMIDDLTMPARRKARELFDSKMRETPLGTIEQINNMKGVFNKSFQKRVDK